MKGKNGHQAGNIEEQIVQEFPHRCPYCDQVVSYESIELKAGENEIKCPSCKETYIKVVHDSKKDNKL